MSKIRKLGKMIFIKIPIMRKVFIKLKIQLLKIKRIPEDYKRYKEYKNKIISFMDEENVIFYLGIPEHVNLGDLAQGYCIRQWLKDSFPNYKVCEISTTALVDTHFSALNILRRVFNDTDFIVFQSGYTTTDLGGFADLMHRKVVKYLPNARMLMMPQTVLFTKEKNKKKTSTILNSMKSSMLFLARDSISYKEAREMFPDLSVKMCPDIVTTLIGKKTFDTKRSGVLFCCRDDEERYYSKDDMDGLIESLRNFCDVDKTDTSIKGDPKDIITNCGDYIQKEIEKYSSYRAIVTDRYHGTIFSLVSNTPVIVVKTTDHKVITGLEWFEGVYDGYYYYADSLEEVEVLVKRIYNQDFDYKLSPYFYEKYYSRLGSTFLTETIKK